MQSTVARCKITNTAQPHRHRHEPQGRHQAHDPGAGALLRAAGPAGQPPRSGVAEGDQRTHRPAPFHRPPHPERPDHRPLRRPPAGRQLPPGHAAAGTGQSGQGAAGRARRGAGPDARAAQGDAPAGEPVDAPGRRDRLRRTHLQRTLGHAGGARRGWPRAAAPDLGGKALPRPRRPGARARLRDAHRPHRPHAQQHHRPGAAGTRTGQRARQRRGARRRGTGTGRALHGRRHLRRPGPAAGRPVGVGAGRPAGGIVAGTASRARPPRSRPHSATAADARQCCPAPASTDTRLCHDQPLAHALGVADARILAGGIEQHHDQVAARPVCVCITRQRPAAAM